MAVFPETLLFLSYLYTFLPASSPVCFQKPSSFCPTCTPFCLPLHLCVSRNPLLSVLPVHYTFLPASSPVCFQKPSSFCPTCTPFYLPLYLSQCGFPETLFFLSYLYITPFYLPLYLCVSRNPLPVHRITVMEVVWEDSHCQSIHFCAACSTLH